MSIGYFISRARLIWIKKDWYPMQTIRQILTKLRGQGLGAVLARETIGTFVVNGLGAVLLYLAQAFMGRVMGVDHYGVFAYALTWALFLSILARIGMGITIVRFGAIYSHKEQWGEFWGLQRWTDRVVISTSSLIAVGLALTVWLRQASISRELMHTFWLASVMIPVMVFALLREASIQSLSHAALARVLSSIIRPGMIIIVMAFCWFGLGLRPDGPLAMGIYALSLSMCFIVGRTWLKNKTGASAQDQGLVYQKREWLGMALPSLLTAGSSLLLNHTSKLLVGIMVGTREVGIYNIVTKTAESIAFAFVAINTIMAPMISKLHASDRKDDLQRVLTYGAWGRFVIAMPFGLLLIFGGRLILGLVGPGFVEGSSSLVVLVAGEMVYALVCSGQDLMLMTGHQRQIAVTFGVAGVINVALSVALLPRMGMMGAAVATATSMALWNLTILVFSVKRLKLNPTIFPIPIRRD